MTDSGSTYDSSEDSDISSRRKCKNRRTVKSRRQRLLAYHQRLVKERGYPLSRFQLEQLSSKTNVSNNPSSGTSLIKGRKLEDEFLKIGYQVSEDEKVVVRGGLVHKGEQVGEEDLILGMGEQTTPGECQGRDWSASSLSNYHLRRSPFLCQDPGINQPQDPGFSQPQPSDQRHHSPLWVWQIGTSPQCSPAFCPGCQSWGSMSLVKLG